MGGEGWMGWDGWDSYIGGGGFGVIDRFDLPGRERIVRGGGVADGKGFRI